MIIMVVAGGILFDPASIVAETAEEYFSRTGNAYVIENGKFTRVTVQNPVDSSEAENDTAENKAAGGISDEYKQANILYPKAMSLVNSGQLEEGLEILKQTTSLASEEPDIHSNYASVLFTKAQQLMRSGQSEKMMLVLNEVEKELSTAIRLYDENPSKDAGNFKIAQCNFLLGEVYYLYGDKQKAKSLYQKALEYYPGYEDALKALRR